MTIKSIDVELKLSSLRALWGAVTPSLRSVSVELQNNIIVWQCIFDENGTERDFELMTIACGEVIADFPDFGLKEIIKIVPSTDKMEHLKNLIYLRHEANY